MSNLLAGISPYPTEEIAIDPYGDIIVKVVELAHDVVGPPGVERPILKVVLMRACSEKIPSPGPDHLTGFRSAPLTKPSLKTYLFHDDSCVAVEVLLRVTHNAVTDATYEISLKEVWEVANVCHKYQIDCKVLSEWFAGWYNHNDIARLDKAQLLYPCWSFDNPLGFHKATKYLAYECHGHVEENNPTRHHRLHLSPQFVGAINSARSTLYGKLIDGIVGDIVNPLLRQDKCLHRHETVGLYLQELSNIGVYPPPRKQARDASVQSILTKLEAFKIERRQVDCGYCEQDFNQAVHSARRRVQTHFQGLCIDCINKPKTRNRHEDYRLHNNLWGDWDSGCRVHHGEPTWWHSWLARQDPRDNDNEHGHEQRRPHFNQGAPRRRRQEYSW